MVQDFDQQINRSNPIDSSVASYVAAAPNTVILRVSDGFYLILIILVIIIL